MTPGMKEVRLYGVLGKRFGKVHRFSIRTPVEAFSALRANFPEFQSVMSEMEGVGFKIFVDFDELRKEQLANPTGREVIRIVPLVRGSGGELWAAVEIYAYMFAEAYASNVLFALAVNFIAITAVSALLAPSPHVGANTGGGDRPDNKASYVFDGAVNTSAQGNPVPVGYGRLMVGSQVLYAGLATEQI